METFCSDREYAYHVFHSFKFRLVRAYIVLI